MEATHAQSLVQTLNLFITFFAIVFHHEYYTPDYQLCSTNVFMSSLPGSENRLKSQFSHVLYPYTNEHLVGINLDRTEGLNFDLTFKELGCSYIYL